MAKKISAEVVPGCCGGCVKNPQKTGRGCNKWKNDQKFFRENGFCASAEATEPLKKSTVEVEVAGMDPFGPERWLTNLVLTLSRKS